MKYNELNVVAKKSTKRVGRGIAAGQGKTAGRGTKGQKARTGHRKIRVGFMGGQRAIMQAVPKLKGFKSIHDKAEVVYTDVLDAMSGDIDNFTLAEKGLISSPFAKVKVISRGEITKKIALKTQFASKTTIASLEKFGGSFTQVPTPLRPKTTKSKLSSTSN